MNCCSVSFLQVLVVTFMNTASFIVLDHHDNKCTRALRLGLYDLGCGMESFKSNGNIWKPFTPVGLK